MKTLHLAIIIGMTVMISIVISVLSFQILILRDQIRNLNVTNQKLATNLTNYQDLFGNISNYTEMSMAVKTSVYVAGPIDTTPVTEVKVNHRYQVISNITKIENTQPIIYYYCIVQVINATGLDPHIGWGQGSLLSKQTFSQCATSWTPTTPGNYTINAFAWRTLFGSPLSEAATRYVQVVP